MTAIAAVWSPAGHVILAADSKSSGSPWPATKLWRMGNLWLGLAGDGAIAIRLQHEAKRATLPLADPVDALWDLQAKIRAWASEAGITRDGAQGQRFVSADLIATDGCRVWLLEDGWTVTEVPRSATIVAIGDPVAIRASYFAAIAGGATPGRLALEIAMHAVMQAWDGAGPPLIVAYTASRLEAE